MVRSQLTINKHNDNNNINTINKKKLKTKTNSCNKSKKKLQSNQKQEFNFEDPHLAKFFQNHPNISLNYTNNNNNNSNSILNNKNLVVIQDEPEDDDRTESIVTTITNESSNDSNDLYLEETESTKFDDIEINEDDTYRVGNWVYCEFEPNQPYSIRRIEDLKKKADGTIEAKLRCAFRRTDLPQSLLSALEKNYSQYFTSVDQYETETDSSSSFSSSTDYLPLTNNLTASELHQLKQRELFYSKTIEIKSPFDVSCLRGKLTLDLFSQDIHGCTDYLKSNENKFFYQINYDPNQKRLSVDKIHIRVDDEKFQAQLPCLRIGKPDKNYESNRETLVWSSAKCNLSNAKLIKYTNDICTKKTKSNLVTNDVVLYEAIKKLHECGYDEKKAKQAFKLKTKYIKDIDATAAASDADDLELKKTDKKFTEAISKCGHDFNQIQKKYFTDKTVQELVEYYYNVYKRTSDYISKRKMKRLRKQNDKLDLLYIPGSSFSITNHLFTNEEKIDSQLGFTRQMCTSCNKFKIMYTKHNKQFKVNKIKQSKEEKTFNLNENICNECWIYWKKYAGYKTIQSELTERISLQERVKQSNANQLFKCMIDACGKEYKDKSSFRAHSLISHALIVKNFVQPRPNYLKVHNFCVIPTQLTQSARLLFNSSIRKLARNPFNKKMNLTKSIETEWFKKPRDPKDYKMKKSQPKLVETKKKRIDVLINKLKSKQLKQPLIESDEDLSSSSSSNSNNNSKTTSVHTLLWRPLTPISCITGEDEERLNNSKRDHSTFLSPSSSINSTKSSNTRRRLDSSSSCENIKNKKIKTTSTRNSKSNDSRKLESLNNLNNKNIDQNKKSSTKQQQIKKRINNSKNKNKNTLSKEKNSNESQIIEAKREKNTSEAGKESFKKISDTYLPIWDKFYFSANNQLRRRLKDLLYPKTLKRLAHSPYLELKPHLYQKLKC